MEFDLNDLTPEEKDELLIHFLSQHKGGEQTPMEDEKQDAEGTDAILDVVSLLCSKVEELDATITALKEHIGRIESVVMDDIVGGIDKLYKGNLRKQSVDGLRGKYGEMFGPHLDALKEMAPDEDVFDKLHDMIEEARSGAGEDFGDEHEAGIAKQLSEALAAKIAKVKEALPKDEVTEEEEPEGEGVTVEKTSVSATPVGDGADPKLIERIKAMKERNKAKGR